MISDKGSKSSDERLLVSVLFVDIIGFSALADQLKPEDVSSETGELWVEFNQIIKEHGGLIVNQLGDSLMVIWGAPESQEDDTEKAVFASLALMDGLNRYQESATHPDQRIDFLWVSPDLKILDIEVILIPTSDHLPVLGEINLK